MPDGEPHHCTVSVRKFLAAKHYQQRKHSYQIAQADDLGFPDHHRQGISQPSVDEAMATVRR
jgi:hypothetical protein